MMFTPNQPDSQNDNSNLDDLFSSSPNNSVPDSPYTPPPPQPQQRRNNPILYIILGVVIAFICLCVGCIGVIVATGAYVSRDPTFQAGFATGAARTGPPAVLPSSGVSKGSLRAGQQQNGQLGPFDQDIWKYKGNRDEQITITVSAGERTLALLVGLYDANGKLLIGNNAISAFNQPQTLTYTLPDDGTYSILVTGLGGTANSNGNYTITVSSNAR
jgi:hypothetical protein